MKSIYDLEPILDENQKIELYISDFNAYSGTAKGLYRFMTKYQNLGNYSSNLEILDMFQSNKEEDVIIIVCKEVR